MTTGLKSYFVGRGLSPTVGRKARPTAIGLLIAVPLLIAGCGRKTPDPTVAAGGPVKIRFQTDWYPQPEHGGYYQALAKGF